MKDNSDLREKIAVLVCDGGRYLSYEDTADKIIALCMNEAIEPELAVIKQAILEARHAQSSGAGWYTKGHSGLFMQVRMWLDKADNAVKAIEKLK